MRYLVSAPITVTAYTVVEAEDEEDAINEALGRPVGALCYHCTRMDQAEDEWRVQDLDGMPEDEKIRVSREDCGEDE